MPNYLNNALKIFCFFLFIFLCDRIINIFLIKGIARYYNLAKHCDVLLLGDSHIKYGIDEALLENKTALKVCKFALDGANSKDRLVALKFYLKEYHPVPKLMVYDVNAFTFTSPDAPSKKSYQNFYPFMFNKDCSDYVYENVDRREEWLLKNYFFTSRYTERSVQKSIMGYLGKKESISLKLDVEKFKKSIKENGYRKIAFDQDYVTAFEETLKLAGENNIEVILLNLPHIDIYNRTQPTLYDAVLQKIAAYTIDKNHKLHFLNYNDFGNDSLESRYEIFSDPIHLNNTGANIIISRLACYINHLEI